MPRVELRVTAAACFKLVVPLPWLLLVPLLLLGGVPSSITTSCGGSQGEVSLASASKQGTIEEQSSILRTNKYGQNSVFHCKV